MLRNYNPDNTVILIANSELKQSIDDIIIYWVEKDEGDSVARKFIDKNEDLFFLLQSLQCDKNSVKRKSRKDVLHDWFIKKYFSRKADYIHNREYS